jgi:RimJ/RimL family protein N-acetyltransferase
VSEDRSVLPDSITTPRLLLRRWRGVDADVLKATIDANREFLRPWLPWARIEPASPSAMQERMARFDRDFEAGVEWAYSIRSLDAESLYGGIGLHNRIGPGALEIGYWLKESATKQGFATEAVSAIMHEAFTMPDIERLEIRVDPRNAASVAIPARLGFVHIMTRVSERAMPDGTSRDVMIWEHGKKSDGLTVAGN